MSISLTNNISTLNISGNLDLASILMAKSMTKLASGWKINSAADDPAGLVISEQMRSQIASLNQEIENTDIAINKYQTADSALLQMRNDLTEIRSLAIGAANSGVNDEAMQSAYQKEADNLVQSYNRTIETSSFGKQGLLDGSSGAPANIPKLSNFDLSTAEAAENSINAVDEKISRLDEAISDIGATRKNSLESHLSNLRIEAQNLTAAESQIRNTDYAMEFANLLRNKLVVQSAVSLLSHGNLTPRLVLSLLSED